MHRILRKLRAGLTCLSAAFTAISCTSVTPNRGPVGETFPSVTGKSLEGETFEMPGDFQGRQVLLLIGYAQKAQFDLDRWLLGILDSGEEVEVYEVPTIKGLLPGLFKGAIDSGMRRGIPPAEWCQVITVYGDAGKIVALTGNENPGNVRSLLLDPEGKVAWFHDHGYSASVLKNLIRTLKSIPELGRESQSE